MAGGARCCRRWTRSSRCAGGGGGRPAQRPLDPKYEKQVVEYHGRKGRTTNRHPEQVPVLVQGDGKALRYGVGVGAPASPGQGQDRFREEGWPA